MRLLVLCLLVTPASAGELVKDFTPPGPHPAPVHKQTGAAPAKLDPDKPLTGMTIRKLNKILEISQLRGQLQALEPEVKPVMDDLVHQATIPEPTAPHAP